MEMATKEEIKGMDDEEKRATAKLEASHKNMMAVSQVLSDQNAKLLEMQGKIETLNKKVVELNTEFLEFKQQRVQDIIARMGNGPTVLVE